VSEVTVTRVLHPLAGCVLQVVGSMSKLGRENLLVVLPDGSKSLIPADWTDHGGGDLPDQGSPILAGTDDLRHACALVSALSARAVVAAQQAASKSPAKEDEDAACSAQFDTGPGSGATAGGDRVAARGPGRRGDPGPGVADRQSRGGAAGGGRR
jgi:hypothetical protein